jgi:Ca2+-binding RTX toxin-like protein
MSLSLFPPSRASQQQQSRRGRLKRTDRVLQSAIEALEPRQLLQGTPTPAVDFTSAEVLSLANATFAGTNTPAATDRPFPGSLFVTDLTGTDQKNGSTYSHPTKALDIVFLGRDGLTVLTGNGNGTFKPAVVYPVAPLADTGTIYAAIYGGTQMKSGFLDLNGDGFPDFVVVESTSSTSGPNETPGSVTVFLGNGDGTFKAEDYSNEVGVNPDALTVANLHISGVSNELDIALTNIGNRTVTILKGNGKGQFGTAGVLAANEPAPLPVGNEPESIIAADVNGDGVPDLLVGNVDDGYDPTISVLVNKSANKGASFAPQFVFDDYGDEVALVRLNSATPSIISGTADSLLILTPNLPLANSNIPSFIVTTSPGISDYAVTSANAVDAFTTGQFPGRSKYQEDVVDTSYRYSTVTVSRGDGTAGFFPSDQTYSTVVQYTPSTVTSTQSNTSGTASASVTTSTYLLGYAPASEATGDMFGDGYPAIVTGDYGVRGGANGYDVDIVRPPAITIITGNPNGTFNAEKQPALEVGKNLSDAVNPTGQPVNDFGPGAVDPGGYPTGGPVVGSNPYPNAIAVDDLTGDGLNDILTAAPGNGPTIASPATGTAFKLSNMPGVITALLNNSDGVAGSFGAAPESLEISGTSSFVGVSTIADFYQPVAVAAADVTGDGVPDLIVLNKVANVTAAAGLGATQFNLFESFYALGGGFTLSVSDSAGSSTTAGIPFNATPTEIQSALTAAGVKGVTVTGGTPQLGANGEEIVDTVTFSPSDGAATLSATSSLVPNTASIFVSEVYGGANKYYTGDIAVYQGDGDGTFNPTPISVTQVGFNPVALQVLPTGDGPPDLVVANYGETYKGDKTHFGAAGSIEVLNNNGNGTFSVGQIIPDAYGPSALAVGTFGNTVSNTSVEDLAVTNRLDIDHEEGINDGGAFKDAEEAGSLQIYLGEGSGTFTQGESVTVGQQPNAVVIGNFNGPSAPVGLAVLNEGEESLTLLRGNGDGTFITQQVFDFPYLPNLFPDDKPRETDSAPVSIAAGDINGDGYTDIVVTYAGTNTHPGYSVNNPGGKIGVMINEGISSADGLGDLAAPVQLITADSQIDSEPFQEVVTYKALASVPDNVAVADMTGDGKNDLVILNGNGNQGKYVGTLNILLNNAGQSNSKPQFNSSTVTFQVGVTGTQTVTTTGFPVPTLSDNSAVLPTGLTISFSSTNGSATISGTPTIVGDTTITLTAANSVGSTSETLSIDINASTQAAQIVSQSGNPLTFAELQGGTFALTGSNFSGTPVFSIQSGTLPTGVSLVSTGTGTAAIEGTPAAGTATGSPYSVTIGATDGISDATLNLTIDVTSPEKITSNPAGTFVAGTANSFTIQTTGFPSSPTFSITSGSLPAGVSLVSNGNGTGTLAGTPPTSATGVFSFTIQAADISGDTATQNFTLTVGGAPAITSASTAQFFTTSAGTFTFTTTGFPTPAFTETGALPAGVSFVDSGNGTALLSGTPVAGSQGTYPLSIVASNGVGTAATQSFTLTVTSAAPLFTNSNGTLTIVGVLNDTINLSVANGQLVATVNSSTQDYQLGSINLVNVQLGTGASTVMIGAGVPAVSSSGGSGTDTVSANNSAADTLTGGSGGADSINASGDGADSLGGSSAGNDTLVAGSGDCTLQAVSGANSLVGGSAADLLEGGTGSDTMVAGGGNNSLLAGSGNESMVGGGGQDFMQGGAGNDTMIAGDGNSTLFSGGGSSDLVGGAGADEMKAEGPGNTTLTGGSSDQTLKAVNGNDSLLGGSGIVRLRGGSGHDTLVAGSGTTTIKSVLGTDSIVANAGNDDLIKAMTGRDTVIGAIGATGMDTIYSVLGDSIDAGPRDVLIGPA